MTTLARKPMPTTGNKSLSRAPSGRKHRARWQRITKMPTREAATTPREGRCAPANSWATLERSTRRDKPTTKNATRAKLVNEAFHNVGSERLKDRGIQIVVRC